MMIRTFIDTPVNSTILCSDCLTQFIVVNVDKIKNIMMHVNMELQYKILSSLSHFIFQKYCYYTYKLLVFH